MQLMEFPLASPLPTTPPHPHDVSRNLLLARQGALATCGWIDENFASPVTCPAGYGCGQNTFLEAVYCCSSAFFPSACGIIPTACANSVYVAESCSGFCLSDPSTRKCTLPGFDQCVTQLYDDASLSTHITGWGCDSIAYKETVYDRYSVEGGGQPTVTIVRSEIIVASSQSFTSSSGSIVPTTPVSSSSTLPPMPPVTPVANTSTSSSLSGGAIAGIVIGAVIAIALIAGLIALLFIRRRKTDHSYGPPNPNPAPMIQTDPNPPPTHSLPPTSPPPPTSPLLDNGRSSFMSNPSATSSTPLTRTNVAAVSQTPSEIRPQDSASNIGGYNGSMLSQNAPPTYHSSSGSQEHSGVASLPAPHYPTGPAAFPNQQGSASVLSPGSAFGSMPPGVHAPTV